LACNELFLKFRGKTPQKTGFKSARFELRHSLETGGFVLTTKGRAANDHTQSFTRKGETK